MSGRAVAEWDAAGMPEVRVVHLCAFSSAYPASFVPALAAIRAAVEARGWSFAAVFAPGAQDRDWFVDARRSGMRVSILPLHPRRARIRHVDALLDASTVPTLLHTHFASWDLPAVIAASSPRRRGRVAVIWHRHGTLSERPGKVVRDRVRFGLFGRAVDAHLCVGPGGHEQLLARGAPRQRTLLFPNAIDVARFPPAGAAERATTRQALGLEPDADVLAAFVWRWNLKGGPLLLQTVRELHARGRRVSLLVVGEQEIARAQARRIGLEEQVRTLAPSPDPRVFFAAADVFVSAGQKEGFSFALLESVCCGTPAVATAIPGHRHFGASLPAVRLSAPSASAMASAVQDELDSSPQERTQRIMVSRDYLVQNAGLDQWVARLLHVYDQALNRQRARRRRSPRVARKAARTDPPPRRS